jgi:hypothetical protein
MKQRQLMNKGVEISAAEKTQVGLSAALTVLLHRTGSR